MRIVGTGSVLPEKVVTNDMLAEFLDTSDEWITTRTGVKSRHVISYEKLEDMAIDAANKALTDAGMKAEDLDFIICSNVVNEYTSTVLVPVSYMLLRSPSLSIRPEKSGMC